MKTASYTVRASQEQAIRWNRAAEAEGFRATGQWLARAADAYLRARAKAGLPIPLAWHLGSFSVRLEGGELATVRGRLSPPFGSFAGTAQGPALYAGARRFTLVYLPDARIIATLRTRQQVMALASELAPTLLRGELPEPGPIVARHVSEVA